MWRFWTYASFVLSSCAGGDACAPHAPWILRRMSSNDSGTKEHFCAKVAQTFFWTAKISPRAFDQKNLTRKWFLGLLWPPNNVNSYVLTPPCSVACPGRELVSPSSWQQAAVNLIWGRYGSSVALTTVNQTEHILVVLISPLPAYFRQTCPCQGWEWGHGWRRWSSLNLSPV